MSSPTSIIDPLPDRHQPDSAYAWKRLALAVFVSTLTGVGMWSVVVALPIVQADFGIARGEASLPYTLMMLGFALGTIVMGRIADRTSIVVPLIISALCMGAGYTIAGLASNILVFALAHGLLIGVGSAAGFGPMMADISHWFVRRRGLAVVIAASGSYIAGTFWPLVMNAAIPHFGWRATHIGIGICVMLATLACAVLFRPQPSVQTMTAAETATAQARADLGMSPGLLQFLLIVAGFACCMAMSMPQVHLVAYCADLGYGVARGAEMLSLMLFLGIISRVGSGFIADRIGGGLTLLIGSVMQALALVLYLFFDGLTSLYLISGIFGLFQGGIVPMYAVLCREFLPPREAGLRIGLVMAATMIGMAAGGYVSGAIYDLTSSYRAAFLNGIAWNGLNLAVVLWLLWRRRRALAVA